MTNIPSMASSEPPPREEEQFFVMGRFGEALRLAQVRLLSNSTDVKTLDIAASCCLELKEYAQAETYLTQALFQAPLNAEICFKLANVKEFQNKSTECERYYLKAIALNPVFFEALNNYANFLAKFGRDDEAEPYYRLAAEAAPNSPDIQNNLGAFLRSKRRFQEAEQSYLQAIKLNPNFAAAFSNLGRLYADMKRYQEAEVCFRRSITLNPNLPDTYYNFSLTVLLPQGRFEEGFKFYEARYDPRLQVLVTKAPHLPFPQWKGESLTDKTIVIWEEQGYGDTIQFVRYVSELRKLRPRRITLVCRQPLHELFATFAGIDQIVGADAILSSHDYWVLALSIPLLMTYNLASIPYAGPYLSPPLSAVLRWKDDLMSTKFKVGLVWRGSSTHRGDADRSLSTLESLNSLFQIPDVEFYDLQTVGEPPRPNPMSKDQLGLISLDKPISNFADIACLIAKLDLVICVDTAVAHLAGAMGKTVWVLLPFVADWRWLTNGSGTKWYPTMRLFRQETRGDWTSVIEKVRLDLSSHVTRLADNE